MNIDMKARYAIYDARTDRDIREFTEISDAYAGIDCLPRHAGALYGVRIARPRRPLVVEVWNAGISVDRVVFGRRSLEAH